MADRMVPTIRNEEIKVFLFAFLSSALRSRSVAGVLVPCASVGADSHATAVTPPSQVVG